MPEKLSVKAITIWTEGFRATGQWQSAQEIGTYMAKDFKNAIKKHQEMYPGSKVEERNGKYYIWKCQLFDNEIDARAAFG